MRLLEGVGGVNTPPGRAADKIGPGSSPADVYPLLLLQTLPSDPAGEGVGLNPFPTGLVSLLAVFLDALLSKSSSFCWHSLMSCFLNLYNFKCSNDWHLKSKKKRLLLRRNFRRSGVSLKFCECMCDNKLTKCAAKKLRFGGQELTLHYRIGNLISLLYLHYLVLTIQVTE
jgi:hypothetical protein